MPPNRANSGEIPEGNRSAKDANLVLAERAKDVGGAVPARRKVIISSDETC